MSSPPAAGMSGSKMKSRYRPMRRPSFGKSGRPITVESNFFALKAPELQWIVQYCVYIDAFRYPIRPSGDSGRRKEWTDITTVSFVDFNRDVLAYWCRTKLGAQYVLAYDGRKTAYSAVEIPKALEWAPGRDDMRFPIEVDRDGPLADRGDGKRDKAETVYLRIRKTSVIDCRPLMDPRQHNTIEASAALAAIDTVLSTGPLKSHVQVGRSFFHENNATTLRGGVEAWRGFYQSARLSLRGLLVNMDESRTPFWARGSHELQALLGDMRQRLSTSDVANNSRVAKLLSGLKVRAVHNGITYRVHGFSTQSAEQATFYDEIAECRVSVKDYFQTKYGVRLQSSSLPCVVTHPRKHTLIPMEMLRVVARQRLSKAMTPEQTSNMIKCAATTPGNRKHGALEAINRVDHDSDPACKAFGISVEKRLVSLRARVLPAPSIQYGENSVDRPSSGVWDKSHNKKLYRGAPMLTWCVLNLTRAKTPVVEQFLDRLTGKAISMGMSVTRKVPIYNCADRQVESKLREIHSAFQDEDMKVRGYPLQLILVVKWKQDTDTYNAIKRVGDIELGVATQVMLERHLTPRRPNDSYHGNLLLKINVKLGGANGRVNAFTGNTDMPNVPFLNQRHIVLGADVTHPTGGGSRPSVAALVGSRDPTGNQFSGSIRNMPPRQELMTDIGSMFLEVYRRWYFNYREGRRAHAEAIIMFRDGVSEGQFQQVMDQELDAIRRACIGIDSAFNPKITYIIVTKRHHARFFPNVRDQEHSGNIPAGTVIDTDLVSSQYYDFYLNSHAGIQGTSRPSKYTVLIDENNIDPDALQGYIYRLAHGYARCNRAVSIVNSAYYAHLLAFRGRAYLNEKEEDKESGSQAAQQSSDISKVQVPPTVNLHNHLGKGLFFV